MSNKGITGGIEEVWRSDESLFFDWKIPSFLSLSSEDLDCYESPHFSFCDMAGFMRVWPNRKSSGWVSLGFARNDGLFGPQTVRITVGIRGSSGIEKKRESEKKVFNFDHWLLDEFCSRSELSEQKDTLMPCDVLTITCQMKITNTARAPCIEDESGNESDDIMIHFMRGWLDAARDENEIDEDYDESDENEIDEDYDEYESGEDYDESDEYGSGEEESDENEDDKATSWRNYINQQNQVEKKKKRTETLVKDLSKLLSSSEDSDVTVLVGEVEFKAHRNILSVRSPVLAAMFQHETAEKASNRIAICDCKPEAFKQYLQFLYTGSAELLSGQKIFDLYQVADKYLADELKEQCLMHIRGTLSVDTFCDTVKLALTYGESGLQEQAVAFATRNHQSIISSKEWQNFIREYPTEANAMLKCMSKSQHC